MSARPYKMPRVQRGQALTEMAIVAAVLVPLFLLVPVLAKYIHLRQTAQQAARGAAWEATVTQDYGIPNRPGQQALLLDRHFGSATAPILSRASGASDDAAVGNVMMNMHSGRALVTRGDVELGSYGNEAAPGPLSQITGLLSEMPFGWSTPNANGLVTARLTAMPQNLRNSDGSRPRFLAPFDDIDLRMRSEHSVLADPWNASGGAGDGPRTVVRQTTGLVPTARFSDCDDEFAPINLCPIRTLGETLRPLAKVPVVGIPIRIELGLIEPDIVPHDKQQPDAP